MESLYERIFRQCTFIGSNVVKADCFLNHQIDAQLLYDIAQEFRLRFTDSGITRILTIESSGIAVAVMLGLVMQVPVVFAKKHISSNISKDEVYSARVHSFTKGVDCDIVVSRKFLAASDNVLIIDDFLATGEAIKGLAKIVERSGAHLAGVGVVIEKGFQSGGADLRASGMRIESMVNLQLNNDKLVLN